jgi:hypothetical protein
MIKRKSVQEKKEKEAVKKNDDRPGWTDPMSGPVFQTWGLDLFRGI